jgi:acetyl esterase/lipase
MTPPDLAEADLSVCGLISYYGILDLADTCATLNSFLAPLTITAPLRTIAPPPALRLPQNPLRFPLAGQALRLAAWVRDVEPTALRRHIRENTDLLLAGLDKSLNSLLGGGPDLLPEEYRMVSALTYAGADSPPTLMIQAAHDSFVPSEPAQTLYQTLCAAGVPAVKLDLPETEHTFDLFLPRYSPPAQAALYTVERFLASLI